MWQKLKDWGQSVAAYTKGTPRDSIQKLVTTHALNRRKNTRIKYSHMGAVGDLPRIFFKDEELNIGNISTGGVLVIDDMGRLGDTVGDLIQLDLRWPESHARLNSRIVGVNLHRRHIQFVDFNASVFVRISQLIKSGFLGSKFRKIDTHDANIVAEELWIGPTSESLVFHGQVVGLPHCELHINGDCYELNPKQLPIEKKSGQPVSPQQLGEFLILLANFQDPSHHVRNLVEQLQNLYRSAIPHRTGTDG